MSGLRLAHVNLPARDPERLARWYADAFGFEARGGFAFAPGSLLVFERGEPARARANSHFGFAVESADAVADWARRFEPLLAPLEIEAGYAGFKAADPEGNVFEVYWEPRPFPPDAPALRDFAAGDRAWLGEVAGPVGGTTVVSRGRLHRLPELPGCVAELAGARAGFAFWRIDAGECELVAIEALAPGRGVGSALLARVESEARAAGCARLWLVTTNDNLDALRFYQRRGLRLAALHRDALARTRELKPELPELGDDGIPMRDELELEKRLAP
jgi:GNAT superfamily N-acetyltransferase